LLVELLQPATMTAISRPAMTGVRRRSALAAGIPESIIKPLSAEAHPIDRSGREKINSLRAGRSLG